MIIALLENEDPRRRVKTISTHKRIRYFTGDRTATDKLLLQYSPISTRLARSPGYERRIGQVDKRLSL